MQMPYLLCTNYNQLVEAVYFKVLSTHISYQQQLKMIVFGSSGLQTHNLIYSGVHFYTWCT